MKYLLILLLVILSTNLHAENTKPLTLEDKKTSSYLASRKPAKLTVQIKNLPAGVNKVKVDYTFVQLGGDFQIKKYRETGDNGIAEIMLEQNLPYQQIWLSVGNYLYTGIYVNEGLTVTIDLDKTKGKQVYFAGDGLIFSGADGELNDVMTKSVLFKKNDKEKLNSELSDLRQKKEDYSTQQLITKIDSITNELAKIDEQFLVNYPNYKWAVQDETLSEIYGELCLLYIREAMPEKYLKKISAHQPYFVSNDGVLFYSYLSMYTTSNKSKTFADDMKLFNEGYSQEKADLLKLTRLTSGKERFSTFYPMLSNEIKTPWVKKFITHEMNSLVKIQAKTDSLFASAKKISDTKIGKPMVELPFNASLYELDSISNADDFLIALKSKFSGKALIIDFWATWCMPCLADLPNSKALHRDNADLPIAYIYLCTSSSSAINLWKNKVVELEIPGTHIFVDDKIVTQLKEKLGASGGFPSYVVIGKEGKVSPSLVTRMQHLNRESLQKIAEFK